MMRAEAAGERPMIASTWGICLALLGCWEKHFTYAAKMSDGVATVVERRSAPLCT
jgi:hypothetical protein